MNREIKFKFWLGHTQKMTYEHSLIEISHLFWDFIEDIIPLQYTGLKDIYEGDILSIQLPLGGFWGNVTRREKGVVKYDEEKAGFIVDWSIYKYGKNQSYLRLDCDIAYNAEKIGNIYETPHLLNSEPAAQESDTKNDK